MRRENGRGAWQSCCNLAGLTVLLLTLIFGKAGLPLILLIFAVLIAMEHLFRFRCTAKITLYWFFLFSPLLLIQYASIPDFRLRIITFVMLAYIVGYSAQGGNRKFAGFLDRAGPGKIYLVALLIFALAACLLYVNGVHLSGDEPHYLMITQSLVKDRDFDLKNNVEQKTYFQFLPVEMPPHLKQRQDRYLSFHMPGLSLLLVPFYLLFDLLGGLVPSPLFFRLTAAVMSAFSALALFYFLKLQFPERKIGAYWLFFVITFPLLFHAVHLYPEIPAAGLLIGAYLLVFGPRKRYLAAGLCLAMILWLHVKYYPAVLVFGLIVVVRLLRNRDLKRLFRFCVLPVASLLLLLLYSKTLYGTFSPGGIFPAANYFAIPHEFRLRALVGYFFDQRDGLLFYAPLFFLTFFSFRKRIRHQGVLLGVALSYLLAHAFTTVRGAHAPAGRPLIFVIWVLIALVLNTWFYRREQGGGYMARFLAGFSLFVLIWLLLFPQFVYQPVYAHSSQPSSSLLTFLGSDSLDLSRLFPSYLNVEKPLRPANFAWLILVTLPILIYYLAPPRMHPSRNRQRAASFFVFLFLVGLFCLLPRVHLGKHYLDKDKGIAFFNNSRDLTYMPEHDVYRARIGNRYHLYLSFVRSARLTFQVINHADADMMVRNKTKLLFHSGKEHTSKKQINAEKLIPIYLNKRKLYPLEIKALGKSSHFFLFFRIEETP